MWKWTPLVAVAIGCVSTATPETIVGFAADAGSLNSGDGGMLGDAPGPNAGDPSVLFDVASGSDAGVNGYSTNGFPKLGPCNDESDCAETCPSPDLGCGCTGFGFMSKTCAPNCETDSDCPSLPGKWKPVCTRFGHCMPSRGWNSGGTSGWGSGKDASGENGDHDDATNSDEDPDKDPDKEPGTGAWKTPCTQASECAGACPSWFPKCTCATEGERAYMCVPACTSDADCVVPFGFKQRHCDTHGYCSYTFTGWKTDAGSDAPPTDDVVTTEPDAPDGADGPVTCTQSADCAGACPPATSLCLCVASGPLVGTCAPACNTDSECGPSPDGKLFVCTVDGVCAPKDGPLPGDGNAPDANGAQDAVGPTPCTSSQECVGTCPAGALGCGCGITGAVASQCVPTCATASDCPPMPGGAATHCDGDGFCAP